MNHRSDQEEKRVLVALFAINLLMFIFEFMVGLMIDSTALVADSLDMLADSTVYVISLSAVGRSIYDKKRAAFLSGAFQVVLGTAVLADIVRRIVVGSHPDPLFMVAVGLCALVANTLSVYIIYKHRKGEVHMRASWIFSRNDVIANIGVIAAGIFVFLLGSRWPDLVIGLVISAIVIRGGIGIMKDAR